MVKVRSSDLVLNNTLTPPLTQQTKMGITGSIGIWVGTSPPAGALLCDGATYNSSTNPQLLPLANKLGISTPGSFQVPNLQGKLPRGMNLMLRATGGSLTIASIGHQHTANTARFPLISNYREVELGNGSWAEDFELRTASGVTTSLNTTDTQINYLPPYFAVNFIIYT